MTALLLEIITLKYRQKLEAFFKRFFTFSVCEHCVNSLAYANSFRITMLKLIYFSSAFFQTQNKSDYGHFLRSVRRHHV